MLDYQRIADDVRNSLSVQGMEDADYLRAIVADFAVACEEVNERLQQCEALLRRGLRSEALHLCEIEPNLLDAVAALDFPERAQWEEFIDQFGLVPPIPLNVGAAEALSEAYAVEQPMAKLLRNHRLLALARGPLCDRINVLRRLADADPANPIWPEDVDAFERVRLEQIRGEAMAAGERGDVDALERLCGEVYDPAWRTPPDNRVIATVVGIRDKLLHARVQKQLAITEQALNDAFSAFDVARGRQLRAQWNELLAMPGLAPDTQVLARAAPALEWLDVQDGLEEQQRRRDAAVAGLQQALDRHSSLAKLHHCYHSAASDGEPLPDGLEDRYRARVDSLRRASARRRYIATVAVLGMLLLSAGGIWWAVEAQAKHSRREQTRQNLEQMIDQGDLDAADNYREQIDREDSEALQWPPIAVLVARLDSAIAEEEQRKKEYRGAVARVEESLEGDTPELIQPDAGALSSAERLAKTSEEKSKVAELAQQIEGIRSTVRDANIQALRADFDALGKQVSLMERRGYASLDQYQEPIQEAGSTLKQLVGRAKSMNVYGLFEREDKGLNETLAKLGQKLAQSEQEERSLDAVTRATGDCEAYQRALRSYADQFVTTPRASDFRRVAEGRAAWEAVVRFSAFVERWNQEVPAQLDPDKAREYLKVVRQLLEGNDATLRETPFGKAVQQRVPLLEAVANRNTSRAQTALQRELDQPIMRACWCVKDRTQGKRYYTFEEPKFQPGSHSIRFVINRTGDQRSRTVQADTAEITVAPQVVLSKEIRSVLASLDHQNWESQLYRIMEAIYRAEDVDELLRFDLLRMALKAACDGSYPMAEAFEKHDDTFSQSKVNLFANWMDPNCPEADKARQLARAELGRVPSFVTAWKQAREQLESLWRPPGSPFRWTGWLRKNLQNQWEPVANIHPSGPAEVFVFCTEGNNVQSVRIGTVQRDEMVLNSTAAATLREGMPLFVAIGASGQTVASQ